MIKRLDGILAKNNYLPVNSKLVVAVSGGVDSVVLLDLLTKLAPSWGWTLNVAHLDHKIRPDSNQDAKLVGRLADQYGHQFYLGQLTGKDKSESKLRHHRYNFLHSILDGTGSDFIVTAHHGDDRIETTVFNAIRGADRHGLVSLKPVQGKIVRPLLTFSKGEIIIYANLTGLTWREDSTNANLGISRNFIRHKLLPLSPLITPTWRDDLISRLDELEALNEKIDWQLEQVLDSLTLERLNDELIISRVGWLKLPSTVQLNSLAYIIRRLAPETMLTKRNLDQAVEYLTTAKTGSTRALNSYLQMSRNYDTLVFAFNLENENSDLTSVLVLPIEGSVTFANFKLYCSPTLQPTAHPNILVRPMKLYVRSWQAGDRINPVGMTGSKKLQDIFVDKKIPRRERSSWPIVVDDRSQPVWVPTLAIDRTHLANANEPSYQLSCEAL